MDLRVMITDKRVQDILNQVSKSDKRILIHEAILHLHKEINNGNFESAVYDPNLASAQEDIKEHELDLESALDFEIDFQKIFERGDEDGSKSYD